MEYRSLSRTGLGVSVLSLGSYLTFGHSVDQTQAKQLMTMAYEAGVNLFDTAELYAFGQAEIIMGQVLHDLSWPRDTYILMTKVFWGGEKPTQVGLHRKHIVECCHTSLKRLQVEYLDLFLCHRPDPRTSMEEIVRAMTHLIQQGKVLYWGTSEWQDVDIMEALLVAERFHLIPPSLEQFEYNMIHRDRAETKMIRFCQKYQMGVTTTMPLAGGLLTGKYRHGLPEQSRFSTFDDLNTWISPEQRQNITEIVHRLSSIAQDLEMSLTQLAIAWSLKNEHVSSVIIGASRPEQLKENLQSTVFLDRLNKDVLESIDTLLGNKPIHPNEETLYAYREV